MATKRFQKYVDDMRPNHPDAPLQIAYVCDASYLQKKMSRVRFWVIQALGIHEDVNLTIIGPGFPNFDATKSLQQNIIDLGIAFSLVIWYKPLNESYNFDTSDTAVMPFKTCLRYNEMWDEVWTRQEIDTSKSDIIISHHLNDCIRYKHLYANDTTKKFYYIPHCSNKNVFRRLYLYRPIDILVSGITKEKHYPFKHRLVNLIRKHQRDRLSSYNIHFHTHPGYNGDLSFENPSQINYNEIINKSKLCVACTSKYNYRLGKYVEIPMAGSVILGDVPFEDPQFSEFIVDINNKMTDDEILDCIVATLGNRELIARKRDAGLEWCKNHTVSRYVDRFIQIINPKKIYIISDEIRDNHPEFKGEKWICDVLKKEFTDFFPEDIVRRAKDADIIWYLAPWNYRITPRGFQREEWCAFLKTKKVIFTQHHIDPEKLLAGQLVDQFKFMLEFGTHYHAICDITMSAMESVFDTNKISVKHLWANNQVFYPIPEKDAMRTKYGFGNGAYLVGSFQKDTEGRSNLPKLSKGPDIFIEIVKDMHRANPMVEVVLTGLRREYIISKLKKANIKYHYFNMIPQQGMNELYACLDIYVVSSRCEGGPRSVIEAGLTKTPIISTKVGISPDLMDPNSLFDAESWETYRDAVPNTNRLLENVRHLTSIEYLNYFKEYLINC
jgi:hypothetical protein